MKTRISSPQAKKKITSLPADENPEGVNRE